VADYIHRISVDLIVPTGRLGTPFAIRSEDMDSPSPIDTDTKRIFRLVLHVMNSMDYVLEASEHAQVLRRSSYINSSIQILTNSDNHRFRSINHVNKFLIKTTP
jgi:hypothetical protein